MIHTTKSIFSIPLSKETYKEIENKMTYTVTIQNDEMRKEFSFPVKYGIKKIHKIILENYPNCDYYVQSSFREYITQ